MFQFCLTEQILWYVKTGKGYERWLLFTISYELFKKARKQELSKRKKIILRIYAHIYKQELSKKNAMRIYASKS